MDIHMEQKTFDMLSEELDQEHLNEIRLLRIGAALAYASQVKRRGDRVKADISTAKSEFGKAKREAEIEDKLNHMIDGLEALCDSVLETRYILGSMTGVSTVSAMLAQRSDKQLQKLFKGKRR
tara:strand:- start:127 stop:495 length:369 start_codon:yes stop_codon:yes gene_type:complete